jgi:hypothetical protein
VRRNLVFAVGANTPSHLEWARSCPERSWDVTLSYFGPPGEAPKPNYDNVVPQGRGVKWGSVFDYFTRNPALLDAYDYVWFPDDDIVCDPKDVDRLFGAMREFDLEVGQPALTMESYYSHLITLRQPGYRMRRTNFVEVMMPCFKAAYFKSILPRLEGSFTGWGLDFGWADVSLTSKAGIIDDIAMTHSRPVGGGKIYEVAAAQGLGTIKEEVGSAFGRFDVSARVTVPLGGIRKDGRVVTGKWPALVDFYRGLWQLQPKHVSWARFHRRIHSYTWRIIRYHLGERLPERSPGPALPGSPATSSD